MHHVITGFFAGYQILFYVVELRMTRLRMLSNRYSLMYYKIIVLFLMNTYLSRLTWYAKELFNNEHHFPQRSPRTFSNSSPNQKYRARKNRKLVVRAKQTTFYIKYKINIYGFSSPLLRSQNFKKFQSSLGIVKLKRKFIKKFRLNLSGRNTHVHNRTFKKGLGCVHMHQYT